MKKNIKSRPKKNNTAKIIKVKRRSFFSKLEKLFNTTIDIVDSSDVRSCRINNTTGAIQVDRAFEFLHPIIQEFKCHMLVKLSDLKKKNINGKSEGKILFLSDQHAMNVIVKKYPSVNQDWLLRSISNTLKIHGSFNQDNSERMSKHMESLYFSDREILLADNSVWNHNPNLRLGTPEEYLNVEPLMDHIQLNNAISNISNSKNIKATKSLRKSRINHSTRSEFKNKRGSESSVQFTYPIFPKYSKHADLIPIEKGIKKIKPKKLAKKSKAKNIKKK